MKHWHLGIFGYWVIGQVAKFKRTWNLAPVSQIVQKITENYCTCLYLSTGQVWWLHDLWFKRYIQKCTLSHVLILVVTSLIWSIMEWLKIQKLEWERNIIFLRNKKILNLCCRWHILRSYRFVAEVTFKTQDLRKYQESAQFSCQNENFVYTSKKLLKNKNQTFPIVRYFTWKLESASNTLWMIVAFLMVFEKMIWYFMSLYVYDSRKRNRLSTTFVGDLVACKHIIVIIISLLFL